MKNYHNIESKRFNGAYTGYSADDRSWRITAGSRSWIARARVTKQGGTNLLCGFETLAEISEALAAIK
jgi:hypothetical protein